MRAEYKRDIIKELDILLESGPVSKIYMDSQELWLYQKAVYPDCDRYALKCGQVVSLHLEQIIELYNEVIEYKGIPLALEKE